MLALALAVACSASIALLFRRSETTGANRYALTSANYLAATAVGAALLAARGLPRGIGPVAPRLREIGEALATGSRLSAGASPVWAALVGAGAGTIFFLAFLAYQIAVRDHGVGLAGSFAKLGILLPTGLSLAVWREEPGAAQCAGMGLAVAALLLVHAPRAGRASLRPALVLLFLFGGTSEFANRVFQRHGRLEDRPVFLLATFSVALLASLVATALARRPIRARDGLLGLLVGVPNLFSSWFLIRALEDLAAPVAFSLYGAGTILVLGVVGVLVHRERPGRAEVAAMVATAAAVVLVQL